MEGRFSDQPDREHGNPLKPVRTRDGESRLENRIDQVFSSTSGFTLQVLQLKGKRD